MEFKTASSKEIVNTLAYNSSLQEILNTDSAVYKKDVGRWKIDQNRLSQIVYALQTDPDIKDIKLYMKNGPATLFETNMLYDLNNYSELTAFQNHDFQTSSIQWFPEENFNENSSAGDNIIVVKNIMNEDDLAENIGVIRVDFKSNTFSDVLDEASISESSFALLVNSRDIICTSDLQSKKVSHEMLDKISSYARQLKLTDKELPYWSNSTTIQGHKYSLGIEKIALTDWLLVLIIPEHDVIASVAHGRIQMITIF